MELRKTIAPDLQTAEQRYPEVLDAILGYTKYCDEHGDEELLVYKQLEDRLQQLTGKNMRQFNLHEWWEEEGALNCKGYNRKLFQRNRNKEDNYFEYSAEEIVEKMWR